MRLPTASGRTSTGSASPTSNGYDVETFERLFPPSTFASFEEWRNTTQYYQSHVLKVQIETLRALKYRPTGGFCFSSLADPAPSCRRACSTTNGSRRIAYEIVRGRVRSRARRRRAAARLGEAGRSARPRRAPRERPARHRSTSRSSTPWPPGSGGAGEQRGDSAARSRPTTWSRSAGSTSSCPTRSAELAIELDDDRPPAPRDQPLHHRRHRPRPDALDVSRGTAVGAVLDVERRARLRSATATCGS